MKWEELNSLLKNLHDEKDKVLAELQDAKKKLSERNSIEDVLVEKTEFTNICYSFSGKRKGYIDDKSDSFISFDLEGKCWGVNIALDEDSKDSINDILLKLENNVSKVPDIVKDYNNSEEVIAYKNLQQKYDSISTEISKIDSPFSAYLKERFPAGLIGITVRYKANRVGTYLVEILKEESIHGVYTVRDLETNKKVYHVNGDKLFIDCGSYVDYKGNTGKLKDVNTITWYLC